MPNDPIELASAKPRKAGCPVCGRPTDAQVKPFCSRRCADVDLARWLNGAYRVPVVDREDDTPASVAGDRDTEA